MANADFGFRPTDAVSVSGTQVGTTTTVPLPNITKGDFVLYITIYRRDGGQGFPGWSVENADYTNIFVFNWNYDFGSNFIIDVKFREEEPAWWDNDSVIPSIPLLPTDATLTIVNNDGLPYHAFIFPFTWSTKQNWATNEARQSIKINDILTQHVVTLPTPEYGYPAAGVTENPSEYYSAVIFAYDNTAFAQPANQTVSLSSSIPSKATSYPSMQFGDAAVGMMVVEVYGPQDIPTITVNFGTASALTMIVYYAFPARAPTPMYATSTSNHTGTSFDVTVDTAYGTGTVYFEAYRLKTAYSANYQNLNREEYIVDPVNFPNANTPLVASGTATVTGPGPVTGTISGLEPDTYYYVFAHQISYGRAGNQPTAGPIFGAPVNSSGTPIGNDVASVLYLNQFSGTGTSITFNLGAIAELTAGRAVYMWMLTSNDITIVENDPDNIISIGTTSYYDIRISTAAIASWLDNGNYNTVTFTFNPATSFDYLCGIAVGTRGSSSYRNTYNVIDDGGTLRYDFAATEDGWAAVWGSVVTFRTGGPIINYPPYFSDEFGSAYDEYREHLISTTFINEVNTYAWLTLNVLDYHSYPNFGGWSEASKVTTSAVTDAVYLYRELGSPKQLVSNLTQTNLQWDSVTYSFDCDMAAIEARFLLFDYNPGAFPSDNDPWTDPALGTELQRIDVIIGRDLTPTATFTNLNEKQDYWVVAGTRNYNEYDSFAPVTFTTPDGPNETVTTITESLVSSCSLATVTAAYRDPTITAVLPDVWQDGLAGIIINTTDITTHSYTRAWVEGTEQIVTNTAKNQLTITAEQGSLADGDYPVALTDYVPAGFSTWTQPPLSGVITDPLAANVSFAFSAASDTVSLGGLVRTFVPGTNCYSAGIANAGAPFTSAFIEGSGNAIVQLGSDYDLVPGTRVVTHAQYTSFNTRYGIHTPMAYLRPDASVSGQYQVDQPFTIEYWFRLDPAERTVNLFTPMIDLYERDATNIYCGFYLYGDNPTETFNKNFVFPGYGECKRVNLQVQSQTTSSVFTLYESQTRDDLLVPEKWYHVALSYFPDATRFNVWLDGRLIIDGTTPSNAPLIISDDTTYQSIAGGYGSRPGYQWENVRITFGVERYARGLDCGPHWWGPYL